MVATAGLAWQIASWRLAHRSRISGAVTHIPHLPLITINVVNHSAHEIRITTINLLWDLAEGHGGRMLIPRSESPLPDEAGPSPKPSPMLRALSEVPSVIKPHDAGDVHVGGDRLKTAMPEGAVNIRALVITADGTLVQIAARPLRDLEDVLEPRRRFRLHR
ncbi:hypothetical protein VSS74_23395 [Conexibacter stalactiti]|uniref:Uncharacterized protein n=1 Tax=Conexibacter stalactiti TaxID=1940611 RepID=A0ABU4HVG0_9ACTN|nr:hypothetical protein [Conexibacter stalactiti]MDW5597312.1 hypothetical protein [Conexibacter stalactiti]MEC5037954.1 hypothetical protein [Conexibacter stalactiti]